MNGQPNALDFQLVTWHNVSIDEGEKEETDIPDEQEELGTVASHEKSKPFHVSVAEKEEKTSLLKELRDCIPEPSERSHRALHPELVL